MVVLRLQDDFRRRLGHVHEEAVRLAVHPDHLDAWCCDAKSAVAIARALFPSRIRHLIVVSRCRRMDGTHTHPSDVRPIVNVGGAGAFEGGGGRVVSRKVLGLTVMWLVVGLSSGSSMNCPSEPTSPRISLRAAAQPISKALRTESMFAKDR